MTTSPRFGLMGPKLTDMMPELASLPDAERKSLLKTAKRKSLRNLGALVFDWSGAVMIMVTATAIVFPAMFVVAFSDVIVQHNMHLRNVERAYNALAQKVPKAPSLQPFPAVAETSWEHWFSTHDGFVLLAAAAVMLLLGYYYCRAMLCFENVVLMIYARAVMAEKAASPKAQP